jgi:DNA-binding NarL/FixJ family response regulator
MASSTAIQESLANIELEIERLSKAREALLELIDTEGDEAEETPKPKSRARRSRAKSDDDAGDDEGKSTTRRSRRIDKRTADRKASRNNGEKGDGKGTRKDQIIALLDEGMSPRDIADELGIATNYVYNVKRGM